MYRLMLYYLSVLYSLTIILSFIKVLPYNWIDILSSGMYLIFVCYFVNQLISRIFKVKPNYESQLIYELKEIRNSINYRGMFVQKGYLEKNIY